MYFFFLSWKQIPCIEIRTHLDCQLIFCPGISLSCNGIFPVETWLCLVWFVPWVNISPCKRRLLPNFIFGLFKCFWLRNRIFMDSTTASYSLGTKSRGNWLKSATLFPGCFQGTLHSGINIGVRLLFFRIFSRGYVLIKESNL